MKKYPVFIIAIAMSVTMSYGAAGDFIRFGSPMYNQNFCSPFLNNGYQSPFNMTQVPINTNPWNNPYSYNSVNPVSKIFKRRNSSNDTRRSNMNYKNTSARDTDIEYLLSKMETSRFGQNYSDLDIENRLDRLDAQMFGAIQSGDYKTRLNRLKRAFSAEATRSYKAKNHRLNEFKNSFSSGYPTSIPVDDDYYSSLEGMFSTW